MRVEWLNYDTLEVKVIPLSELPLGFYVVNTGVPEPVWAGPFEERDHADEYWWHSSQDEAEVDRVIKVSEPRLP